MVGEEVHQMRKR